MLNCFTGIATLITHLINIIKININNLHKTRNAITFSLRRHIHHRHISPVSVFKSYVHNFCMRSFINTFKTNLNAQQRYLSLISRRMFTVTHKGEEGENLP